ncbi:alpha/beta fold hydrolase [Sutcliffiella rhizosphaerae]|uniref:Proline iminopeptidase n=1 Tax=Sutcliffiella rhizosphaerae TaxID=2880967 RepID=A0ABM8YKU2_9BACI|nr:alpha/beta hydrolase [Sutcliffiella rhizosphaerae]CAG9620413.1 Proline iminopeptidase [Sutcliffiella rhizosphaerae]
MWKQEFLETERGTFEYFSAGMGEPLAITHMYMAFDERGNLFANPFTNHYKVYLINIRGAGQSVTADHSSQLSMKEATKDLEAIRAALGLEKWSFAGHSTGGMLALQYAINFPHSLTKIVVGCASASNAYASHKNSIYCSENKHFSRIVEIMDLLNNSDTVQEQRQKLGYEWALMSYYSADKLNESMKRPNSGSTVGENLDYFRKVEVKNFDLRNQLNNIKVPTYIYAGKYDAQCPVEFSIEMADHIPSSQLKIFKESNHHPYIEEEEKFREFVKNFKIC